jgi:hypothetical protein
MLSDKSNRIADFEIIPLKIHWFVPPQKKLHCRPDVSEIVVIKLPVTTATALYGETKLSLDIGRIDEYLNLSDGAKDRLAGFLEIPRKITMRLPRLNYLKLSGEYQDMLDNGEFKNRAELARHLGVSRAWITKVLKYYQNQN